MAVIIAKVVDEIDAQRPEDWPTPFIEQFMQEHYGRQLTWREWWKERSDRMAPDGSDLTYNEDGTLTF